LLYVCDYPLQGDEKNRARYASFGEKDRTYGVFELAEGAVMRHHDRAWIEGLFSAFQRLSYREVTVTTMNGSSANAFQLLGRRGETQVCHEMVSGV